MNVVVESATKKASNHENLKYQLNGGTKAVSYAIQLKRKPERKKYKTHLPIVVIVTAVK